MVVGCRACLTNQPIGAGQVHDALLMHLDRAADRWGAVDPGTRAPLSHVHSIARRGCSHRGPCAWHVIAGGARAAAIAYGVTRVAVVARWVLLRVSLARYVSPARRFCRIISTGCCVWRLAWLCLVCLCGCVAVAVAVAVAVCVWLWLCLNRWLWAPSVPATTPGVKAAIHLAAGGSWAARLGLLFGALTALARALECTARRLHVWNYAKVHAAGQHAASKSSAGRPGNDDTRIVPLQAVKFPTKTTLLTALLAVRTVHWLRAAAKHAGMAAATV